MDAGRIAAGSGQARDEAELDGIVGRAEYDRNARGRALAASAGLLETATITATGRRTNSSAIAGSRSYCPSAKR